VITLTEKNWLNLSEDELWHLANDRTCSAIVRREAMQRWLFPAQYGYLWATDRVESARKISRMSLREKFRSAA
jgi:hypothetical protein